LCCTLLLSIAPLSLRSSFCRHTHSSPSSPTRRSSDLLAIEHGLPAMVHTPHRDKAAGTKRTLDLVQQTNIEPGMVVVDHLNEVTVEMVKESGCWMGFSIYPDTKMDPHRMVAILQEHGLDRVLVNSAAD